MRRTMLFLPSNNPNMLINGGQLGADSLIFDLEDAVSPGGDHRPLHRCHQRHAQMIRRYDYETVSCH